MDEDGNDLVAEDLMIDEREYDYDRK